MLSKIWSTAVVGVDGIMIEIEIDLTNKFPRFDIVGLPDAAIREAKYRVRTAMINSNYTFPYSRILINLAPANIKKQGPQYDLPIALGLLTASMQLKVTGFNDTVVVGELALDGSIRPVPGILSMVLAAYSTGIKKIICPFENANEAAAAKVLEVYPARNLTEAVQTLHGEKKPQKFIPKIHKPTTPSIDFDEVLGQESAKRAILIAASGRHHCLMLGSPGCGKSMIAKRMSTILPILKHEESIETTKIYSIAHLLSQQDSLITIPPFRSPHHTISNVGLVGGGSHPRPGEISLAHNGILFIDEFPEFPRKTLDMLRQPLESGNIVISRARETATFPCYFLLIGAMNPCPCGYFGDDIKNCTCSPNAIQNYQKRISGPLLDRFDLHIAVSRVKYEHLTGNTATTNSQKMKETVIKVRQVQEERLSESFFTTNSQMPLKLIKKFCILSPKAQQLMEKAIETMGITARAYQKILKVSRTIADIESSNIIEKEHIAEAIQYRSLDTKLII